MFAKALHAPVAVRARRDVFEPACLRLARPGWIGQQRTSQRDQVGVSIRKGALSRFRPAHRPHRDHWQPARLAQPSAERKAPAFVRRHRIDNLVQRPLNGAGGDVQGVATRLRQARHDALHVVDRYAGLDEFGCRDAVDQRPGRADHLLDRSNDSQWKGEPALEIPAPPVVTPVLARRHESHRQVAVGAVDLDRFITCGQRAPRTLRETLDQP